MLIDLLVNVEDYPALSVCDYFTVNGDDYLILNVN